MAIALFFYVRAQFVWVRILEEVFKKGRHLLDDLPYYSL